MKPQIVASLLQFFGQHAHAGRVETAGGEEGEERDDGEGLRPHGTLLFEEEWVGRMDGGRVGASIRLVGVGTSLPPGKPPETAQEP